MRGQIPLETRNILWPRRKKPSRKTPQETAKTTVPQEMSSSENPEDRLLIEGHPFMDEKLKVIGVLTQNVTTVMTQRALRTGT